MSGRASGGDRSDGVAIDRGGPALASRVGRRLAPALILSLALPPAARGQSADLERELELLERGQRQILRQIDEIRRQLGGRPTAAPAGPQVAGRVFDLGANPVRGERTAPLTLVEFTDYQ